jgi:hypothetical protein
VRLHRDFDAAGLAVAVAVEPDILENKSRKALNRVQNGLNLQLNSWFPGRGLLCFVTGKLLDSSGISYFLLPQGTSSRRFWAGAASGGDKLPNASSHRRRSQRVTDSPAPAQRRASDAQTHQSEKSIVKILAKKP